MAPTRKTATSARKPATTARKASARSSASAAAKADKVAVAASSAAAKTPKVVSTNLPVVGKAELKKKELIDAVAKRADIKRKDAKPAVEAMLAILGESLSEGREMNLQPFGKLKINRVDEKASGQVVICRVRRSQSSMEDDGAPIVHQADKPAGGDAADTSDTASEKTIDRAMDRAAGDEKDASTPLAEPAE